MATLDLKGRVLRSAAWWDLTANEEFGKSESEDNNIRERHRRMEVYNYTNEYINIPFNDFMATINSSVLSGNPFTDFCVAERKWFYPSMASKGFFEPLSDYTEYIDFTESKWIKFESDSYTYNGKIYGSGAGTVLWPRDLMMWNKTLFEKYDQPNLYDLQKNMQWTWDKWIEIAQKLTILAPDGTYEYYGTGGPLERQMLMANNVQIVKFDEAGKPLFDLSSDQSIEALNYYSDIFNKYIMYDVPPGGSQWDYYHTRFQDGFNGTIASAYYKVQDFVNNMQDDYGVVLFPMGPSASDYTHRIVGANQTLVLANNNKPEEIVFVYNLNTEPVPGNEIPEYDPPWGWHEVWLRDFDSLTTIGLCTEKAIMDVSESFSALDSIINPIFGEIRSGSKSPMAAVEEVKANAQKALD